MLFVLGQSSDCAAILRNLHEKHNRFSAERFSWFPRSGPAGASLFFFEAALQALLVAIKRGQEETIPNGDTLLTGGDYVVGLLPTKQLDTITEKMSYLCKDTF